LNIKCFTNNINNTNNITNKRNTVKYTKPILSFPELGAGALAFCQQPPGSTSKSQTGLRSRWTQECKDRDLNQDHRQDKKQGPLQQLAMDEESETPQL